MTETVDVVVVGMGPGAEDAAGRLAEAGLEVVGVEAELVGGECPYWGCVPSKMMIRAADLLAEARRVKGMAGEAEVRPDWDPVARRIRDEATDDWDDTVAAQRFEGKGGRLVRGWGRLEGPDTVAVGDQVFEARRAVIVGIGTRPVVPPIPGLADTPYWTNRQAIETEAVPDSLVVLGGGSIGCELAQVFSRFGAQVSVADNAPVLVAAEEPETSQLLEEVFHREGITTRTGAKATAVDHADGHFRLTFENGDPLECDALLVAAGRRSDLSGLNVSSIGIDPSAGVLPVDDHMRVEGAPKMWAVGDVTGKGAFTHMSMYQADIVVNDVLGRPVDPADYRAVPRVTFTDPEIGSVGMTERDARQKGLSVRIAQSQVPQSTRGWIHKAGNDGFLKLVADADHQVLVGATSVGPWGGEVLGLLALAVHAEVPIHRLATMIYAYPTFHRAIESAVKDLVG
jgi:pyruvate/2-oxoglutarate dehydrogenase complex dihydrolipoamide dehydrogenase (E3) component